MITFYEAFFPEMLCLLACCCLERIRLMMIWQIYSTPYRKNWERNSPASKIKEIVEKGASTKVSRSKYEERPIPNFIFNTVVA